ncbi:alpha/beta fold hydrolase [Planctobacterium marinum]|uniref:alpha/beta hydrolase n=1 Tax=Planctobacterium marinum TaxID=1631968 RepID=UPI001E5B85EB|nr:alpha/beta hydrolase [Planctobacterium marinum]MCC2604851.1 alpha/beta hydrolase [Planctobacterium marinum]
MMKMFSMTAALLLLSVFQSACATIPTQPWQGREVGNYSFTQWPGGKINVEFIVPQGAGEDTPVLLVIPGAKRNADEYRDQWHELALKHQFVVLAIGCSLQVCDSEYLYNLGGLTDHQGQPQPEAMQFYSVPELVFDDFVRRFGSAQTRFALYGHSAGGGFVHTFMLNRPNAPVSQAVAANPAFFTMPDESPYPFGLGGTAHTPESVDVWLQQPLTIMLGDQDTGPRTKALSNSARANAQGRNVFSRGLRFYATVMNTVIERNIESPWRIDVVQGVGHSSTKMVPGAVHYLFPEMLKE